MKSKNLKVLGAFLVVIVMITSGFFVSQAAGTQAVEVRTDNVFIDPAGLDKDTPEDVATAAKNAAAKIREQLKTTEKNEAKAVLREAEAAFQRIAQDRGTAQRILELSRKKDKTGIKSILKQNAPTSDIEIQEVKDFTITVSFSVRGYYVSACGSSTSGCSGGSTASVKVY